MVALHFLTVFHWPGAHRATPEAIGESSALFPLIGILLGLILASCNWLLDRYVPPSILSIGLVLLMTLMTRSFHLDGLADTFDGLGAKGGQDAALQAMRDSRTGVFGVLAVVTVLSLKFKCLEIMRDSRPHALLLSPMLGRWAMLVLAYNSRSPHEGLGRIMVQYMKGRHLLWGSLFTVTLCAIVAGFLGLWLVLSVFLFACAMRGYFRRRIGGVTGDTCGAVGEMTETLSLTILALLEWHRS